MLARSPGGGCWKDISAGQSDLVKLVIDTDKLISKFVFDWSPSTADTFPHIYGPVNLDAVVDIISL
ncbi:MAG: DUF952 domain-containing protein [Chitinophagaceae bacterium]|nr:DUF952 domain-containing protein [Chitinophagaceae bacterium]